MKLQVSPDPQGRLDPTIAGRLSDVLITALEGGINSWVTQASIPGSLPSRLPRETGSERHARLLLSGHWQIRLDLAEPPVEGAPPYVHLSLPAFLFGVQLAAQRAGKTLDAWFDNHDAEAADSAIQYAIFGHLVYS